MAELRDSYTAGSTIPFDEAVLLAKDRDRHLEAAGTYTIARDPGFFKDTDPDNVNTSKLIVQNLTLGVENGFHDPEDVSPEGQEKDAKSAKAEEKKENPDWPSDKPEEPAKVTFSSEPTPAPRVSEPAPEHRAKK